MEVPLVTIAVRLYGINDTLISQKKYGLSKVKVTANLTIKVPLVMLIILPLYKQDHTLLFLLLSKVYFEYFVAFCLIRHVR